MDPDTLEKMKTIKDMFAPKNGPTTSGDGATIEQDVTNGDTVISRINLGQQERNAIEIIENDMEILSPALSDKTTLQVVSLLIVYYY